MAETRSGAVREQWRGLVGPLIFGALAQMVAWGIVLLTAYVWHWPHGIGVLISNDTDLYRTYALKIATGLRPYADFRIEYPPLATALMLLPGHYSDRVGYVTTYVSLMIGCSLAVGSLVIAAAARIYRNDSAPYVAGGAFALAILAMGGLTGARLDMVVALALAAWLFLVSRARFSAAAFVLGLGFAFKMAPAILLPLTLVLAAKPREAVRAAAWFAVSAIAPYAVFAAYGRKGLAGIAHVFVYNLARPIPEIESVWGTALELAAKAHLTQVRVVDSLGAQAIVSPQSAALGMLATATTLLVLLGLYALVWMRRRALAEQPALVPLIALAILLGMLLSSRVFSPQYMIWLMPFSAILAPRHPRISLALIAATLLTGVLMSDVYTALVHQRLAAILLVATRDALLLAASVACGFVVVHAGWGPAEQGRPRHVRCS